MCSIGFDCTFPKHTSHLYTRKLCDISNGVFTVCQNSTCSKLLLIIAASTGLLKCNDPCVSRPTVFLPTDLALLSIGRAFFDKICLLTKKDINQNLLTFPIGIGHVHRNGVAVISPVHSILLWSCFHWDAIKGILTVGLSEWFGCGINATSYFHVYMSESLKKLFRYKSWYKHWTLNSL